MRAEGGEQVTEAAGDPVAQAPPALSTVLVSAVTRRVSRAPFTLKVPWFGHSAIMLPNVWSLERQPWAPGHGWAEAGAQDAARGAGGLPLTQPEDANGQHPLLSPPPLSLEKCSLGGVSSELLGRKFLELGLAFHKRCAIGKCINEIFANQIVFKCTGEYCYSITLLILRIATVSLAH